MAKVFVNVNLMVEVDVEAETKQEALLEVGYLLHEDAIKNMELLVNNWKGNNLYKAVEFSTQIQDEVFDDEDYSELD